MASRIAAKDVADSKNPSGAVLGLPAKPAFASRGATLEMNRRAIEPTGSGTATSWEHPNVQPFQCINYIIALQGIYPSRN